MAETNSTTDTPTTSTPVLSRCAQRIANKRAKRSNPTPQALAARKRASTRRRACADLALAMTGKFHAM